MNQRSHRRRLAKPRMTPKTFRLSRETERDLDFLQRALAEPTESAVVRRVLRERAEQELARRPPPAASSSATN